MEDTVNKPILYNFHADWCKACGVMLEIGDKISEKFSSELNVINVDIDQVADLRDQYRIDCLPVLILTREGEELDRMVGFHRVEDIESRIKERLSDAADESA